MKGIWDYENTIDYAKEKAAAEAEKRGEARGSQIRAEATARKMLAEGLSLEVVARCTDLSEEQIRAL